MTTYEIVSATNANQAEREILTQVHRVARELASVQIRTRGHATDWDAIAATGKGLNLAGVRLAFLNTQMELAQIVANAERHRVSDYATLVRETECYLYGYALTLAEDLAA